MEKEAYLNKLKEIEDNYLLEKNTLHKEYALSNAKFKVGDTIKDDRWVFTIDKITVFKGFSDPEAVYHGFELKKDLTPKKNRNRVCIHGNRCELVKSI